MAKYPAYIMAMKVANIAEFKNRISEFLSAVEKGEEIEVRKRNIPIARVVPIEKKKKNRTVFGCGKGTVEILGDITGPLIPEEDWEMLKDDAE
jgi:prevent-host-death family protein